MRPIERPAGVSPGGDHFESPSSISLSTFLRASVRAHSRDMSDADLAKQIRELETKLGVLHSEPEILPPADESTDSKPT